MNNTIIGNEKNILFYSDENGQTKVEVLLQDENVWLNVNAIATLFDVQRPVIVKHIKNIYNDENIQGIHNRLNDDNFIKEIKEYLISNDGYNHQLELYKEHNLQGDSGLNQIKLLRKNK